MRRDDDRGVEAGPVSAARRDGSAPCEADAAHGAWTAEQSFADFLDLINRGATGRGLAAGERAEVHERYRLGIWLARWVPWQKRDPASTEHDAIQGGGQVLDLCRELRLASRGEGHRVVAPRQALPAALEELLLPLGDRRLAHPQPACHLDLGRLALEDREHDGELLVGRLERLAAHLVTTSLDPARDHTSECPTQSDAGQTLYAYDALGRQVSVTLPWTVGDATIPGTLQCTGYDELGNTLTEKQAWVDGMAQPPSDCSGATRTTSHVYDLVNRETSRAVTGGDTTTTGYDAAGDATSTTTSGATTTRVFDGLGNAVSESTAAGQTTGSSNFSARWFIIDARMVNACGIFCDDDFGGGITF